MSNMNQNSDKNQGQPGKSPNQGQQNQHKNQQGDAGQDPNLNPQGNRDIRQAPASPNAN